MNKTRAFLFFTGIAVGIVASIFILQYAFAYIGPTCQPPSQGGTCNGSTQADSAGNTAIGTSTSASYKLNVGGKINTYDSVCISGDCKSSWSAVGGPWSTSTTGIYYNSGNVGIGTNTPSYPLDIRGGGTIQLSIEDSGISGASAILFLNNTLVGTTPNLNIGFGTAEGVNRAINFRGNGTNILTLYASGTASFPSGNVGIGITNPSSAKLEVNGNELLTSGGYNAGYYVGDTTNWGFTVSNSSSTYYTNVMFGGDGTNNRAIRFMNGPSTELVRINSLGNVGIGTTSPGVKLDVNGAGRFLAGNALYFQNAAADANAAISNPGGAGASTLALNASGGNVGIGTTTPPTKLDVEGDITVNGNILYSKLTTPKRTIILTAPGAVTPTTNGAAKTQVDGTNYSYYVLDFDPATNKSAYWQWVMPSSYSNGTIDVTYYWMSADTTGNVVWCFQAKGTSASGVVDSALSSATCDTAAVNGTGNTLVTTLRATATSNFTNGQYITFKVYRDAANVSDTAASNARLLEVMIKYLVNTETD